jgi:predicted kinase
MMPYFKLAVQFDYTVQVVLVSCGVETARKRNEMRPEHRRIPDAVIAKMASNLVQNSHVAVDYLMEKIREGTA